MLKKTIQNLLWKLNYDISKLNSEKINIKDLIYRLHPIKLKNTKMVRIGNPSGDGGYLVPDILNDIKYVFSLGVGNETSFEEDMIKKNIKCFSADFSVNKPKIKSMNFEFTKKFVKSYNSNYSLRFDDWKNTYLGDDYVSNILLQIDIEGDEYSVIPTIDGKTMLQTKIMIVEFHHLTRILDHKYQKYIISCFERILEYFSPVHLHVNNSSNVLVNSDYEIPHLLEATFVNKNCVSNYEYVKEFPSLLDRPCVRDKKEIVLPKSWFRN